MTDKLICSSVDLNDHQILFGVDVAIGLSSCRVDDQRADQTIRVLHSVVTVVPKRAYAQTKGETDKHTVSRTESEGSRRKQKNEKEEADQQAAPGSCRSWTSLAEWRTVTRRGRRRSAECPAGRCLQDQTQCDRRSRLKRENRGGKRA